MTTRRLADAGTITAMLASGPIVVRVLNSGTDWLSLAAIISTGVVGLAGIGGTIWVAGRGWGREDRRAKVADKRRVYANCLAALNEALLTAIIKANFADDPSSIKFNAATTAAWSTVLEVQLIAPVVVGQMAADAFANLHSFTPETRGLFIDRMVALQEAMRIDLGEPPVNPVGATRLASEADVHSLAESATDEEKPAADSELGPAIKRWVEKDPRVIRWEQRIARSGPQILQS